MAFINVNTLEKQAKYKEEEQIFLSAFTPVKEACVFICT